jgi:hypothetical protein
MYLYYVMVPANIYVGRNFDFRCAQVPVLAQDEWGAQRLVNLNQKRVVEYLSKRKVGRTGNLRYLIPHRQPEKNVFFKSNYYVRTREPGFCWNSEVLCPDDLFHRVDYFRTKKTLKINIKFYMDEK